MLRGTRPRVAFLAGTLLQGGAERQLYYMATALRGLQTEVRVLCLTRGDFWERKLEEAGIPVVWVGKSPQRPVRLMRIIQEIKRCPVDVIQSQHFYTNLYAALAARALGAADVGAIRSTGIREFTAQGAFWGTLHLKCPNILAVNSQHAIRNAMDMGIAASRLFLLPNVVDTEHFRPRTERFRGCVQLLAVGRLVEAKRFDRFLRIVRSLCSYTHVRVRGIVVGDGPLREQLEQKARELGLFPDRVEFVGSVPDVRQIYQQSDILVLTSDHEGTPNVVLEAMACGMPVVAAAVGGVPDLVRHGETGCLVRPENDEEGFVDCLLGLVRDPKARQQMGQKAREHVESHYSVERLPGFLLSLYERALAVRHGRLS